METREPTPNVKRNRKSNEKSAEPQEKRSSFTQFRARNERNCRIDGAGEVKRSGARDRGLATFEIFSISLKKWPKNGPRRRYFQLMQMNLKLCIFSRRNHHVLRTQYDATFVCLPEHLCHVTLSFYSIWLIFCTHAR